MLVEVRLGSLQVSSFSVAAELGATRLQSVSHLAGYHVEPECIMIATLGGHGFAHLYPPKGIYKAIYIYKSTWV